MEEPESTKARSHAKQTLGRRELLRGGAGLLAGLAVSTEATAVPANWDGEYDVIVLGCGVAGSSAALEAMRSGARVLVIDSGGAGAAASHGTWFYMGGGTALQRAQGVEDTPENMLRYLVATAGPAPDEPRIRVLVEHSVADFEWLRALGAPFEMNAGTRSLAFTGSEHSHPFRDIAQPVPRGHRPVVPGFESGVSGGGAWLQRRVVELLRADDTRLLLAAEAHSLVCDSDGVVCGATAIVDGTERRFRARRGVIIATGGFAHNRAMLAQHAPDYLDCKPTDLGFNKGWGIRAGQSVGAAVRRMGSCDVTWPLYPPAERKQGVLVNGLGQRFVAEDAYQGEIGDRIVREQRGKAYLIVDERVLAAGPGRFGDVIAASAPDAASLATQLGMSAPALQNTIDTYSAAAGTGSDPLLHKAAEHLRVLAPPFTAIDASLTAGAGLLFFTLGGLQTNLACEVLDPEGAPIPGLYAAGRASSGIPGPYYYSSGLSLADCLRFGRIAGLSAARAS